MRIRLRAAALAGVLVTTGLTAVDTARADTQPATLFVVPVYQCSDSGPGSRAVPFCTIQAAVNAANPGQTVLIDGTSPYGSYRQTVDVTRSGTAAAPITITTTGATGGAIPTLGKASGATATLHLSGVHDVHVSYLTLLSYGAQDGVAVTGSHDVTLDHVIASQQGTRTGASSAVSIDGSSANVTVSRGSFLGSSGYSVRVSAGAAGVTVANNRISTTGLGGIHVSGAAANVVSNSIASSCGAGILVDGAATVVAENNLVSAAIPPSTCAAGTDAGLSVAADSTATVRADYNSLNASAQAVRYVWAGTQYATAAAFAAGTGQGANDIDVTTFAAASEPAEHSPLIDSADPNAPGELSTDINGQSHVDDPLVPSAGTGSDAPDRGAYERQDPITLTQSTSPSPMKGVGSLTVAVTITSGPTSGWGEPVSYSIDFGDGSTAVPVSAGSAATHLYSTPGLYTAVTTASDSGGSARQTKQQVTVGTATPPPASLTVQPDYYTMPGSSTPNIMPGVLRFTASAGAYQWEVADNQLSVGGDIGTATSTSVQLNASGVVPVTLKQTDLFGRVSTATAQAVVGDGYLGVHGPVRAWDTRQSGRRIPAHGWLTLTPADLNVAYTGVEGVVMTVTVLRPPAAGYLSVNSAGAPTSTSVLSFGAGQAIANQVNAASPSGNVLFYNGSAKPIDITVDVYGLFTRGQGADTYVPTGPTRLLDTRNGVGAAKAPVAAHGDVTFQVAGTHGVPNNAAAVVLNVTAVDAKANGDFVAYGGGIDLPGTSDGTFVAGQTATHLAAVELHNGKVILHNGSTGTVNFFADLVGYYNYYGAAALYVPIQPARLLDTKHGVGTGGKVAKLGPKQSLKLKVGGVKGIPASVGAVAVNLEVADATANGGLMAYPDGTNVPAFASLAYASGQLTSNMAITPVGPDGVIDLYNAGTRPVNVYLDVSGFYYSYPSLPR